ncbi:MAG: GAF domain-containing protein [Spirochaetes bacterium]|nr:GAF domain-containing protein [Spirochaetota bacterium]
MLDDDYQSLKEKYEAALNVNNLLKVRLKTFEELANIINSEKDIVEALNNTLDIILKLFKVPSGSIMLLDRSKSFMEIGVARGDKSGEIKNIKINVGEGIAGKVVETGDSLIVNDVASSSDFNQEIGKQIDYIPKNILCVPIKIADRILGCIEIMDKFDGDFTEDDKDLLLSIGNSLGIIISNVNLYRISKQTVERLKILIDVSKIINTTMDLQELLSRIMTSSKDVLEAEGSSLMLIDEKTRELYFNVTKGVGEDVLKEVRIPMGKGIAGLVAQNGEPINVKDAVNDDRVFKEADQATRIVTKNMVAVPMHVKDKVTGVLEIINAKNRKYFDEYDQELLQALADHAGIAIFNRDLISNLKSVNLELERSYKEIKAMYEMTHTLTNETDIKKLFEISVYVIRNIFEMERISIMLIDNKDELLKVQEAVGIKDELIKKIEVKPGELISGYVFRTKEPLLVKNMDEEKDFGRNKRFRYKVGSFISVPIRIRGDVIGVLSIADKKDGSPFDEKDLMTFVALTQQIGKSYENIIYYNEFLKQQRFEKELEVTRNIQQHVLPKDFPELPDLDIYGTNIPAKEVGGDFYDYMQINEKTHSLLIADVSGKSLPASMFMAFSRSITRVEAYNLISPSRVLEESNKYIFKDSEAGMFVTMFYFVVHSDARKIVFGSAGHNDQLFYKNGEGSFEYLNVKGIPLGISPESKYLEAENRYETGDLLVLYTDGVTEAISKVGEEFGMDRLKEIIVKSKGLSAREIADNILEAVNDFSQGMPQFDDITLLILKFK